MFKSLVPKNEIFYELFDQISANTVEGVANPGQDAR